MTDRIQRSRVVVLMTLMLTVPAFAADTKQLDNLLAQQTAGDKAAKAAQGKIDSLDDGTQEMLTKYRRTLEDTASITKYNAHLTEQVVAQRTEIASINAQLQTIETTSRDVFPLMEKMVTTLEQFVALDMPFRIDERTKRVATLKGLMDRADVTVSEKYRRILEAYQIEMEYGRTIDSYEYKLGEGDNASLVEVVRVGRVALMYRRPDGKDAGYWDKAEKKWVSDTGIQKDVERALRVAKKQGAPDLLWVQLPAPTEVQP
jgi:Protein of unknown function (DUF3450)